MASQTNRHLPRRARRSGLGAPRPRSASPASASPASRRSSASRRTAPRSLYHAELECFVDLNPQQAGVHMSRFEEIVDEAIDEVVARRGASAPRSSPPTSPSGCASARAACAPRSRSPPATPRPCRPPSPGSARRRSTPCFGTAVASERGTRTLTGVAGPGHDRLPLRPGDGRRAGPRAARRAGLRRRADRAGDRRRPDRHPQPARHRHPLHRLPGGRRGRLDARELLRDRRELDELGDLRADEAPRRAGRRREGARPAALRRGLRARDDPPGGRGLPRAAGRGLRHGPPGEPGDDPPPQRRRRALRPARRPARGAGERRAPAPPPDDARVAREPQPPETQLDRPG